MLLLHTNAFFRLVYTRPQGQFFQYLGYAFQSSSAGTPDPSTVERRKNKQKEYETVIKMSLAPDVVDGAERSSGDVFLVKRNRSVITKKACSFTCGPNLEPSTLLPPVYGFDDKLVQCY